MRVLIAISLCACSAPPVAAPRTADEIAIVVSETDVQGARLVAIDERGDRRFDLLEPPDAIVRDTHPAVSPDGRWVVFASTRSQSTHLWIAPMRAGGRPTQLTTGAGEDAHPSWTRDGRAIVFASTREGGTFHLFEIELESRRTKQLTDAAGHQVTPSIAASGAIIYTAITPTDGGGVISRIERREPSGEITALTEGPGDSSPSLSPNGRVVAFVRPAVHQAGVDGDLFTMPASGGEAAPLVDVPLTDEGGPVWSPDGRYLFATSVLRGALGNAVFSSVIVVDTSVKPRTARMLKDRAGAVARLTPAITRARLDTNALAAVPEYLPELARIIAAATANTK
jgi:Tol biopolymer transport system component